MNKWPSIAKNFLIESNEKVAKGIVGMCGADAGVPEKMRARKLTLSPRVLRLFNRHFVIEYIPNSFLFNPPSENWTGNSNFPRTRT